MERKEKAHKAHCLIVPYPLQGHINPMLQFSKRLQHRGIKITLAATKFVFKTMNEVPDSIAVETISDGFDDGMTLDKLDEYLYKLKKVGSETLFELIEKIQRLEDPIDSVVYDAFMPWSLDVAKKFGLTGACFFTQSCAVSNIYYHVHEGLLKLPLPPEAKVMVSGLPPLDPSETPSFVHNFGSFPPIFDMVVNQFINIEKADWVLFNSFHKLEEEVIDWMAKLWPVRAIGPTLPSKYLDKRLADDKDYGLKLFKPMTDTCMKWLTEKPLKSVVYVSFGSLAEIPNQQMEELAWGLLNSGKHFLWVVRASEQHKLPNSFVSSEASEKGLIVSWCPQLEVLTHESVGCFVTHCGWNSTLEALSLGVPMVAMPRWTDQSTNAKFVMDFWKMGIWAKADGDSGVVTRDEIEHCIKEVMEGDRGVEIGENAMKWKELSREAVDEGGSSDKDIEEFVSRLICS